MTRRLLALAALLVTISWWAGLGRVAAERGSEDPELAAGIRQAQAGDFATAVMTLDSVARRLSAEGSRSKELARAYAYLAVSYMGLNHIETAKAKFLEAWKADRDMSIDTTEFAPNIVKLFEQARDEGLSRVAASPRPASPAPATREKKSGSKTALIVIGAGAVIGGGIALAAGGTQAGSPNSASSPGTSTTTTTTISAAPTDILLMTTAPAPSSTISTKGPPPYVSMRFSVVFDRDLTNYELYVDLGAPGHPVHTSQVCASAVSLPFSLKAGQPTVVDVGIVYNFTTPNCSGALPLTTTVVGATLQPPSDYPRRVLQKDFNISYTFTQ